MKFQNVLAFSDGRPEGALAVEVAASIARPGGGRLTLLHVVEPQMQVPEFESVLQKALAGEQLEDLDRLRAIARKFDVEVTCEARTGRPFVEIIRTARRAGCDLVVKAAQGRGKLGWPLLGSTALHLVRKCPIPVWLVGEREPIPRRILAVLETGTASDEKAEIDHRVLDAARSLAVATDAEFHVGAAWSAPGENLLRRRMAEAEFRDYVENARLQAEDEMNRAIEPFRDAIDPKHIHLRHGVPFLEIVGMANQGADLVVIGTTPPRGGAAFLIREEAEEVINRLETSIVAVKPDGFVSPVGDP